MTQKPQHAVTQKLSCELNACMQWIQKCHGELEVVHSHLRLAIWWRWDGLLSCLPVNHTKVNRWSNGLDQGHHELPNCLARSNSSCEPILNHCRVTVGPRARLEIRVAPKTWESDGSTYTQDINTIRGTVCLTFKLGLRALLPLPNSSSAPLLASGALTVVELVPGLSRLGQVAPCSSATD